MKQKIFTRVLIFIGIIVVVNLIVSKAFFRLDFTSDKRYTLSKATEDILEDLDDVVTVKAYFTEDLPPQLLSTKKDFEDLLMEYETRSGGNIYYEFINPNENEDKEREAQMAGIQPLLINVVESDQQKQLKAYLGVVLQMSGRKEIIPVVQPGAAMEYSLTTAVKKISLANKPSIALLQGNGEPGIDELLQVVEELSVLYNIDTYTISDTSEIPQTYKAVAIINPTDSIPDSHLRKLDNYLQNGGGVYLAYSPLKGDLQTGSLSKADDIGIRNWLSDKGIEFGGDFLVDAQSASVTVQQRQGPFVFNTPIPFPYFPQISNFADHPASKGLESVILTFVSSINFTGMDSSVVATPLALTSENTGFITPPSFANIQKEWTEQDFNQPAQPVAVAFEGKLVGGKKSKLVVVANGDFAINGKGQEQRQVQQDNAFFAVNGIDWLSDDTGLIDLRTKGITSRPIEKLEDSTRTMLKYANVFAPILLIILYALFRAHRQSRKRQAWIEGNF